ncbi:MAG: FAD-dependent oxidoreductase, partial [Clostridia bacterium]|nr:FAD-dependent oxidoreductase [Clostridia bacterium]
ALCAELDLPFRRTGQYLCFRSRWLLPAGFFAQFYFRMTGIRCRYMTRRALHKAEPELSAQLKGALLFPDAGVVSPYLLTIALAENAIENGARVSLDTAVTGMEVQDGLIRAVRTNRGTLRPRVVVNAAGVFAEELAGMAGDRFFSIHPRRGTNAILDPKASHLLMGIASSYGSSAVRRQHTKGGGLVRTVDGNLLCGPDAVETIEKENFATRPESIRRNFDKQRLASPMLSESDIITYFTGVRAATYEEDFIVRRGLFTHNLVHAAGIQSPGLTAAPAIAEDVAAMAVALLAETKPVEDNPAFQPRRRGIVCPKNMSFEARSALIAADPAYGEIICRCEQISRGEIRDALHRRLPCDTIDGVKRRVRPGMGRCQGAFCGPQVLRLIAEEKGLRLTEVSKSGPGSELLLAEDKYEEL